MSDAVGGFIREFSSFLLSPFILDFWDYFLFGVRGLVTYAALHGAYLTWRFGSGGGGHYVTAFAMAGMGVTYLILLAAQLPWYQTLVLTTPLTLFRDMTLLIILIYHLRHHENFLGGKRRQ